MIKMFYFYLNNDNDNMNETIIRIVKSVILFAFNKKIIPINNKSRCKSAAFFIAIINLF